jgi:mannose-6-phosphate isomerase-like protein (cupin superfamily)
MPRFIPAPVRIPVPGDKQIHEYVGRVNTESPEVSVAHMKSPSGWSEPAQTPEFREITVVLSGSLRVEHQGGVMEVKGGQAIIAEPGEWVRYSTPGQDGAEYVAICLPAFTPEGAHRDDES